MYIYERGNGRGYHASEYQLDGAGDTSLSLIGEFDEFYPDEFLEYVVHRGTLVSGAKYLMEFMQDNFYFEKKTYIYLINFNSLTGKILIDNEIGGIPNIFCCYELATPELLEYLSPIGFLSNTYGFPALVATGENEGIERAYYFFTGRIPHKEEAACTNGGRYSWVDPKTYNPAEDEVDFFRALLGGDRIAG